MRVHLQTLCACALLVGPSVASRASAQETPKRWAPVNELRSPADAARTPNEPAAARPSRNWYGWQTLIVDSASLALELGTLVSLANGARGPFPNAVLALSLNAYELGTPIVHWAHGNVGAGFASLGMRLVTPLVGFVSLLGGHGATDVWFGFLTAIALIPPHIDAAVLAYATTPAAPPKAQAWLMPTFAPARDGASVGLAGGF